MDISSTKVQKPPGEGKDPFDLLQTQDEDSSSFFASLPPRLPDGAGITSEAWGPCLCVGGYRTLLDIGPLMGVGKPPGVQEARVLISALP